MKLNEFAKIMNIIAKENWFTLLGMTICLVLLIYTPNMINSAVNECNNYWLEKQQEQKQVYPGPVVDFNATELPDVLFVRDG